jgi:hypothetical protein
VINTNVKCEITRIFYRKDGAQSLGLERLKRKLRKFITEGEVENISSQLRAATDMAAMSSRQRGSDLDSAALVQIGDMSPDQRRCSRPGHSGRRSWDSGDDESPRQQKIDPVSATQNSMKPSTVIRAATAIEALYMCWFLLL